MKIVVTGGAGFIGKATMAEAQRYGHEVWSFDRYHGQDILFSDSIKDGFRDADAVIHLAGVLGTAELFDTPDLAVQINIQGSLNVMQWCVQQQAMYVGILMPDVFPSMYTATKIATQRIAAALTHSRGLRAAHVRAFNAFGIGQKYGIGHPQKIVPTFAVHAWHRRPLPIWGDGQQGVDLISSDQIGRMLVDAASGPGQGEVYDAGTGTMQRVLEVAQFVASVTDWLNPEFNHLPMRDGEIATEIVATGEGWDQLGWQPSLDLQALRETVLSYAGTPL